MHVYSTCANRCTSIYIDHETDNTWRLHICIIHKFIKTHYVCTVFEFVYICIMMLIYIYKLGMVHMNYRMRPPCVRIPEASSLKRGWIQIPQILALADVVPACLKTSALCNPYNDPILTSCEDSQTNIGGIGPSRRGSHQNCYASLRTNPTTAAPALTSLLTWLQSRLCSAS